MQALPAGGVMVAVRATEAEVLPLLTDGVSVAAINGPRSVVLSGVADEVAAVAANFKKSKRLRVSHAFHSRADGADAGRVRPGGGGVDLRAAADPGGVEPDRAGRRRRRTPDYWVRHVREAVRFADGIATLENLGVSTFVEIGPDGVLSAMGADCVSDAVFVPVQRSDRDQPTALLTALAQVFVRGVAVDWTSCLTGGRLIDLPTYAFQHERYWPSVPEPVAVTDAGEPADADFWAAVEDGDLARLGITVDSAGDLLPALVEWRRKRQDAEVVDGWRYRATWRPVTGEAADTLDGRWLIVGADRADESLVGSLARTLTEAGAEVLHAHIATELGDLPAPIAGIVASPDTGAELLALVQELVRAGVDRSAVGGDHRRCTRGPRRHRHPGSVGGLGRRSGGGSGDAASVGWSGRCPGQLGRPGGCPTGAGVGRWFRCRGSGGGAVLGCVRAAVGPLGRRSR